MNYLARGPLCWGRGNTIEEAVKNMKDNWPCKDYCKYRFTRKTVEAENRIVDVFCSEGDLTIEDCMGTVYGPNDMKRLDVSEWIDMVFKKKGKKS